MNKKWILGIISLLMIGLVTANLVSYLSNTKTMTVKIQSPMVMKFDEESYEDTAIKVLDVAYGGDPIDYKVYSKNQATTANINSYPITTIISSNVWTGQEFDAVTFKDVNGQWEILDMLYVVQTDKTLKKFTDGGWNVADLKELKLFFDNDGDGTAQTYIQLANSESWNEITITTNQGMAPGIYTIKLCHLNDLAGSCL